MRRHKILYYSLIFVLFTACGDLFSQISAPVSATGHIFAEVIPVFSASETAQMNFGRFSPGPQGGEIILTPESTVTVLGSVYAAAGLHNAASFYVSGDNGVTYSITLPSGPVEISHVYDAKSMFVDDWRSAPAEGTGTGLLQNGFQVVYVGATLKVGTLNDNPVGLYTGLYSVTFDFN